MGCVGGEWGERERNKDRDRKRDEERETERERERERENMKALKGKMLSATYPVDGPQNVYGESYWNKIYILMKRMQFRKK